MLTVEQIPALRDLTGAWRRRGERIALVPTMGNLHAGHLSLVELARRQAERVVVSLFVNPTQFGPGEDFAAYPRTPEADAELLRAAGVSLLYRPPVAAMYPGDPASLCFVEAPGLSEILCGRFRPGHFRGVATVVMKLFQQVQPDLAVFGEKDFQQLLVIRRMTRDLDLPVRIVGAPTVRDADGLALSSRNAYLSPAERARAGRLIQSLREAAGALRAGDRDFARIEAAGAASLEAAGFAVDYFSLRREADLAAPEPADLRLVALAAARLGRARLIDNLRVRLDRRS